jgi:hypothetical protein
MSDNDAILKALALRRAKIAARFKKESGSSVAVAKGEIQRLLESLNHPASYYAAFTDADKGKIRKEWTDLAASIGISLTEKTKKRKRPPSKGLPSAVLQFFGGADCIPQRPRATNDYTQGSCLHSWEAAAKMRSIQLNPPAMTYWLIFDCDHCDAERWKRAGLPEPSFIVFDRDTGRHHVVYRLSAPVCTSERAHPAPIEYMRAVREALRVALGGDSGYVGLLTKNPLHPEWGVIRSVTMPSYTLKDLARTVILCDVPKRRDSRGIDAECLAHVGRGGRNQALFDAVRYWSYQYGDNDNAIREYADECNALFPEPLEPNEVATVAGSVARYCNRVGRSKRQHSAEFLARQAARGCLGGRPSTTGVSQPWIALGISRATWYRHERKKSLVET